MTIFTKPKNLNGTELIEEMAAAGIVIDRVLDNGDGTIELATDDPKAAQIVESHDGTQVAPDRSAAKASAMDKLAALGLTADEVAILLG